MGLWGGTAVSTIKLTKYSYYHRRGGLRSLKRRASSRQKIQASPKKARPQSQREKLKKSRRHGAPTDAQARNPRRPGAAAADAKEEDTAGRPPRGDQCIFSAAQRRGAAAAAGAAGAGAGAGRILKSRSRPLPTHPGMKYFRKETLAVDVASDPT